MAVVNSSFPASCWYQDPPSSPAYSLILLKLPQKSMCVNSVQGRCVRVRVCVWEGTHSYFPSSVLVLCIPHSFKMSKVVNKTLHYMIGNIADHIGAAAVQGPAQQPRLYSERDRPPHPKCSPMTSQCHSCSASTHLPIRGLHRTSAVHEDHSPAPLERVEAPTARGKENSFRRKSDK